MSIANLSSQTLDQPALRRMAVSQLERRLENLTHGDHVCPIHENAEEQLATAVPFIRDGLVRGERSIFVANDHTLERLIHALAAAGVDVAKARELDAIRFLNKDAIRLLNKQNADLRSGAFEPQAMIRYLQEAEHEAIAEGFSGLRFAGEMTWALEAHIDGKLLVEYEAMLNDFLTNSRTTILCQYHSPSFDPALIHDVLRSHPLVILGKLVCPNPYYEPPELVLRAEKEATSEFKRKRVDWWITRLKTAMTVEQQREQAVTDLKEKEELIRLLLDSTAEAIYGIDPHGNCTLANPACARLLGYDHPRQLTGKNMHALIHHTRADGKPYPEEESPIELAFRKGECAHVDNEVLWRIDGTAFDAEYWSHPVRRDGQTIGAVVTFMDISDRKKLQEQLRQSQKMEAIGQLSGGVAHDFNNLLSVITGYSELLMTSLAPTGEEREWLEAIKTAAERSASLTRQLLSFSRKQVLAPKVLDLNHVVADTQKMLRRTIGEDIQITTVLAPDLGSVKADPGQIEQVLLNLTVNARDAMPHGGKLTIQTTNVQLDQAHAASHPGVKPGSYILLTVADSGVGMSHDIIEHIFEPFFTTKGPGKGTGLGLSVVHGVATQSGGHVDVSSQPGIGTTFGVYLPRVDEPAPLKNSEAGLAEAPRGTQTILLVEDEDAVRALAQHILRGCGYTVLQASHGDEALETCLEYEGPIELLVTDVVMPGIGGRVLADRVHILRPDMKVLYLSGYTDDAIVRHGILHEQVNFLQKPFKPAALARMVHDVLNN